MFMSKKLLMGGRKQGLEFVGASSANTSSVTLPTHRSGDLILIRAARGSTSTAPSLPAGWTNLYAGGNSFFYAVRFAYKFAASGTEQSGTWTNATSTAAYVFRGVSMIGNNDIYISGISGPTGQFNSIPVNAESFVLGLATFNLAAPPSGMIALTDAAVLTDGPVSAFPVKTFTYAAESRSTNLSLELRP